jgi:GNAT superfamily N-acetyltransferase
MISPHLKPELRATLTCIVVKEFEGIDHLPDDSADLRTYSMTHILTRRESDLDRCVEVLADVHAADGYPLHWPADPVSWLSPANLLIAWIVEGEDGLAIGHVALCVATGDPAAPVWSAASGYPPQRLAVVAKLFISPHARGRGLGAALLTTVCAEARRLDVLPALEVLDHDRSAIALYERAGWRRVASVSAPWAQAAEGQALLHYYLAPI